MKLQLTALLPGLPQDMDALPDLAAKKTALEVLVLVRDGTVSGVRRDWRAGTGDLGDCSTLYVDPDGSATGSCIGDTPDQLHAVAVQAVAVSKRANRDAHRHASASLRGDRA